LKLKSDNSKLILKLKSDIENVFEFIDYYSLTNE